MRILIVSTGFYPHIGGKSTHITDLIKGLRNKNVIIDVLSYRDIFSIKQILVRIPLYLMRLVSPNISASLTNILFDYFLELEIQKLIKSTTYDCISVQDPQAAKIIGKLKLGVRTILTMHSYFGLSMNDIKTSPEKLSKEYFDKKAKTDIGALKYVDEIIAVDSRIGKHCAEKIKDYGVKSIVKNVHVIPNFTDSEVYKPVSVFIKNSIRSKYGYNEQDFVYVCARRLVDKNGVLNAVKAMEILHKERNDIILLIAGDGPRRIEIESYIMERNLYDVIHYLGEKKGDDLLEIYKMSDAALVPSITVNGLQEATSISALEAMSCGLPTIASNIGGLAELIDHNTNGLLVEENKITELSNTMLELVKNKLLYKKLSEAARITVVKKFSIDSGCDKYLRVFQDWSIN